MRHFSNDSFGISNKILCVILYRNPNMACRSATEPEIELCCHACQSCRLDSSHYSCVLIVRAFTVCSCAFGSYDVILSVTSLNLSQAIDVGKPSETLQAERRCRGHPLHLARNGSAKYRVLEGPLLFAHRSNQAIRVTATLLSDFSETAVMCRDQTSQ